MGFNRHRCKKNFTSCTPSMTKNISIMNQYGEIIKFMDNSNKTAAYPLYGEIEDCNHVLLCKNNRDKSEEWVKSLVIKLKSIKQHKNTNEEEGGIMKEMVN